MYVCICNAVTESDIKEAVSNGANCMPHLKARLKCSTKCGNCTERAAACLSDEVAKQVTINEPKVA